MKNKIFTFALIVLGALNLIGLQDVNATTVPSTVKMRCKSGMYYFSEKDHTDYISGYNFYRKELKDGRLAYCVGNIDKEVPASQTLSLKGAITDKGLDYIIKNGYPNKTFTGNANKDYYITQAAIWEYFDETQGTNNWKKTSFTSSCTGMKAYVYTLVQQAKVARKTVEQKPSISMSIGNKNMSLSSDGKYFVSENIKVVMVSTKETYTVSIDSAPKGTVIKSVSGKEKTTFAKNEEFVVYVPVSSVSAGKGEVVISATTEGITSKTYQYSASCSRYQKIAPVTIYEQSTGKISAKITLTYEKIEEKPVTKLKISKKDITTKEELAGAKLVIKDQNDKVVASWTSTDKPHYIDNLAVGTYKLEETQAPSGYVLSTEKITFTVAKDGTVKTLVMYNTKEEKPELEVTKLKISKKDITTKEELAGAKLVIKNQNDKVVASWTSTDKPHYIDNLAVGTYTLEETQAPSGYVLSTEKITFTVAKDGTVKTLVMYNAKETKREIITKVIISKKDITTKEELAGATLVIKNQNGKEVASWVSTNEPHYIEKLPAGEYTLEETQAPSGYILSTEKVNFVVKADGSITNVVMYNAKEEKEEIVTKVIISKQDITNKEELPGATLVIKDKDGNVVKTWVSGKDAYYIEGLNPGEYTLEETEAPDGYKLSTEKIDFTVKADGSITNVVMYNARYTEVPITDLNVSTSVVIGAVLLILMGTGMVFYAKRSY